VKFLKIIVVILLALFEHWQKINLLSPTWHFPPMQTLISC